MLRRLLARLSARADTLVARLAPGEQELTEAERLLDRGDAAAAQPLIEAASAAGARGSRLDVARARALYLSNQLEPAAELLDEVLTFEPQHPAALAFRAAVTMSSNRPEEALSLAERAVSAGFPQAWLRVMMGVAHLHARRDAQAVAAWEAALRIEPEQLDALNNLAQVQAREERWAEADAVLTRLEPLVGRTVKWLSFRAAVLFGQGHEDDAWPVFEASLALPEVDGSSYLRFATALLRAGRTEEALAAYTRALELMPDDADIAFSLALTDLTVHGFSAERWRAMDARFRRHPVEYAVKTRLWDEQPLAPGQTLLVYHEQGIGDVLLVARFLPAIARLAAGPVLFGTLAPMRRLIEMTAQAFPEPWRGIVITDEPRPPPTAAPYNIELPLMSIVAPLPDPVYRSATPYLATSAALREEWQQRLGPRDGRRRVGLVWAGNPARKDDSLRSIPTAQLATLGGPEVDACIQWVNLQMDARPEHKAIPLPLPHLDPRAQITDFADTAAIMQQLDLVISIDTSAAHLAGALAVPCWVLLSRMHDWRWEMADAVQPWYAKHRSFRVERNRQWQPLLERVRRELLAWARS